MRPFLCYREISRFNASSSLDTDRLIAHKLVEVCVGALQRLDTVIRFDSWIHKNLLDQPDDAFSTCVLLVRLKSV